MGICGSTIAAEQKISQQIQELVDKDQQTEARKIKLLLLGAGESGKSTVFKQMRILYGTSFTDDDRKNFRPVIFNNVLLSMKTLIQNADELGYHIDASAEKDAIAALADDAVVDEATAAMIAKLWADAGVQTTYDNRARFQLNDSAKYYFDKVAVIGAAGYIPTTDDVLRSRVRTSGIVEEKYNIEGVEFVIYDVGGQRNERKKWIHCFDSVTAVIFVASLSEYDQVLFEDQSVNRMHEAIGLFSEICNSRYFANSSMILFLNKRDLFEEKIKKVDLRHDGSAGIPPRFTDYTGGCDFVAAKTYITDRFLEVNRRVGPKKKIAYHVTCATDTGNVRVVFNTCKDAILHDNTVGSGFMD